MDNRIKLIEKLRIQLQGHLYIGDEKREGWEEPAPIYMFKCPKHGYVKNRVIGYNERLECPECLKELQVQRNEIL